MLYTFDGASLCSLVAGLCNWLPLVVTAGYSSYSESVLIDKAHPIDQLLELPGVGSLDAGSVCTFDEGMHTRTCAGGGYVAEGFCNCLLLHGCQ